MNDNDSTRPRLHYVPPLHYNGKTLRLTVIDEEVHRAAHLGDIEMAIEAIRRQAESVLHDSPDAETFVRLRSSRAALRDERLPVYQLLSPDAITPTKDGRFIVTGSAWWSHARPAPISVSIVPSDVVQASEVNFGSGTRVVTVLTVRSGGTCGSLLVGGRRKEILDILGLAMDFAAGSDHVREPAKPTPRRAVVDEGPVRLVCDPTGTTFEDASKRWEIGDVICDPNFLGLWAVVGLAFQAKPGRGVHAQLVPIERGRRNDDPVAVPVELLEQSNVQRVSLKGSRWRNDAVGDRTVAKLTPMGVVLAGEDTSNTASRAWVPLGELFRSWYPASPPVAVREGAQPSDDAELFVEHQVWLATENRFGTAIVEWCERERVEFATRVDDVNRRVFVKSASADRLTAAMVSCRRAAQLRRPGWWYDQVDAPVDGQQRTGDPPDPAMRMWRRLEPGSPVGPTFDPDDVVIQATLRGFVPGREGYRCSYYIVRDGNRHRLESSFQLLSRGRLPARMPK